jgi:DNA-binding GntR family transcriptional regulator
VKPHKTAKPPDATPRDAGPRDARPRDARPRDAIRRDTLARDTRSGDHSRHEAAPGNSPERIANLISKGILQRRYAVGQRLVEADLMRALGVGRSTVREALRVLGASGVVELTPHKGAVIRALTREDAERLLVVIEVLSGLAARLAAEHIGRADHRRRFAAAAQRLIEPRPAAARAGILDERAHYYRVMFEIADNPELDRAMPQARVHLFRTQFYDSMTDADLRQMVREYRAITDAILAGDAARAEDRMRRHIRRTGERTLPRLRGAA